MRSPAWWKEVADGKAFIATAVPWRWSRVRHLLQHTAGMPLLLAHDQAPATACHEQVFGAG